MAHINLEAVDTDGAIREAVEEVSGDTRLARPERARRRAAGEGYARNGRAEDRAAPDRDATGDGALAQEVDIGILNYALTLEYLGRAFYNEATAKGKIQGAQLETFLKVTTHDERAHVQFLPCRRRLRTLRQAA